MSSLPFEVPHLRPERLADPVSTDSDRLRRSLEKRDDQLGLWDYRALLDWVDCYGTYEETCYFLPRAFRFMIDNPKDAFDLATYVFQYANEYRAEIEADGLMGEVRNAIRECLDVWTERFAICAKCGNHVTGGELVDDSLAELARGKTFADIATSWIDDLARSETPARRLWYLEIARATIVGESEMTRYAKIAVLTDRDALRGTLTWLEGVPEGDKPQEEHWLSNLEMLRGFAEDGG